MTAKDIAALLKILADEWQKMHSITQYHRPRAGLLMEAHDAIAELVKERDGLREALRKYGMHVGDCPRNLSQPNCDWEQACTCGYDAALAASGGEV